MPALRSSSIAGLWMVTSELANVGWGNSGSFCYYWRGFTHPINNDQRPDTCLHVLHSIWDHPPYYDYCCQVSCTYLCHKLQIYSLLVWNYYRRTGWYWKWIKGHVLCRLSLWCYRSRKTHNRMLKYSIRILCQNSLLWFREL